jgi:N-acetylmuramic acid 6-phosphate etherase
MDLAQLTTEGRNPASEQIDRLSPLEIVRLMNAQDALVSEAVAQVLEPIAQAVQVITARLSEGGRLVYLGAGTSGRLGVLDASECPPTFNSRPWQVVGLIAGGPTALTRAVEGAEDSAQRGAEDLQGIGLTAADAVVGIATSGRTPYVIGGLRYARQRGAWTAGLACNADSALTQVADLMIVPVVGPEIISGSTRLKAGTATKLVLNMLTTAAMIRLGKTYGNLMVDLQTTNEKLTHRSRRLVAELAGVAPEEAAALLTRCGGDTKTAIVSARRRLAPDQAAQLLTAAQGRLRTALELDVATAWQLPSVSGEATPTDLVIGLDGGGSKTVAWLCRSGEIDRQPAGVGQSGPSNPLAAGWNTALDNVDLALERAFHAAGWNRGPVRAACLSLAGAGRDADRQRIAHWARQRQVAEQILVTDDAQAVLAAGTPAGVGVALICGTGSLAFGRSADGRSARAGGW